MSWLRIDDAISVNGKLGDLSDADFRALVALWSYCSRKRNGGTFTLDEIRHAVFTTPRGPRSVKPESVSRYVELGLVNTEDGAVFSVNDWSRYQPADPTGADRQRSWRKRHGGVT